MAALAGPAVLLLLLSGAATVVVPPECAKNVSARPAVCCPVPSGHSAPCGFPSRGACRRYQVPREQRDGRFRLLYDNDFRVEWPVRVFQVGCHCVDRFWGPDCGECWFGREGADCRQRVVRTRRRANKLSKKERLLFRDVFALSRKTPSRYIVPTMRVDSWKIVGPWRRVNFHQEIVLRHWFAVTGHLTSNSSVCKHFDISHGYEPDFCHSDPLLPLWHRLFFLYWERNLAKIAFDHFGVTNFTLPFWDWTDLKKCDVCTNDFAGAESKQWNPNTNSYYLDSGSPLSKFEEYCANRANPCQTCLAESPNKTIITRRWVSLNFPSASVVAALLKIGRIYSPFFPCGSLTRQMDGIPECFCGKLGVHRKVHLMTSGTFRQYVSSANDPLFILHHVQLDRIFQRWHTYTLPAKVELPSLRGSMPNTCRHCNLVPFLSPVSAVDMYGDTRSFGYKYEDLDFGSLNESTRVASYLNESPTSIQCPKKTKNSTKANV